MLVLDSIITPQSVHSKHPFSWSMFSGVQIFIVFLMMQAVRIFWPVEWNQLHSIMVRVVDRWKRVRLVCMWYISIAEVDGTVLPGWKGNILF